MLDFTPMKKPQSSPEIMTANEVAEYFGITIRSLHRAIRKGIIPGFQLGGKGGVWRFDRQVIKSLIMHKSEAAAEDIRKAINDK